MHRETVTAHARFWLIEMAYWPCDLRCMHQIYINLTWSAGGCMHDAQELGCHLPEPKLSQHGSITLALRASDAT